jgi:hypothetical protein
MPFLHSMGWLFSGVFLINTIPHLVHGLSGDNFPSAFSRPHGKKLSSPVLNVIWAFINLLLCVFVTYYNWTSLTIVNGAIAIVGAFSMSIFLANYFRHKDKE